MERDYENVNVGKSNSCMLDYLRAAVDRWKAGIRETWSDLRRTIFIHIKEALLPPSVRVAKMSIKEDGMLPLVRAEMTPIVCKGSWEV